MVRSFNNSIYTLQKWVKSPEDGVWLPMYLKHGYTLKYLKQG